MPPQVIEGLVAVVGLIGVGSVFLVGLRMRYSHLQKMKGAQQQPPGEAQQLADHVTALSDEVRLLREDYAELFERVEFAERLLTRGRAGEDADGKP